MDLETVQQLRELPYCTCNDEPYALQGGHRTSCPSQWVDDVIADLERLQWLIANGERHFGTLWREATAADIDAARGVHSAGVNDASK